jgi:hypothetical protein
MEYVIIMIPKQNGAALGRIVQDDLVSRQTLNIREAKGLGMPGDETYVLIEGSEPSLKKAVELVGAEGKVIPSPDRERIRESLKKAEDEVAEGLGLMFG